MIHLWIGHLNQHIKILRYSNTQICPAGADVRHLTRPQLSSDLGVGLSTLNKWVQQHQHDDLMSGPHEDVEKENTRLRKEVRLLREEREVLKKAAIFFAGQSR